MQYVYIHHMVSKVKCTWWVFIAFYLNFKYCADGPMMVVDENKDSCV